MKIINFYIGVALLLLVFILLFTGPTTPKDLISITLVFIFSVIVILTNADYKTKFQIWMSELKEIAERDLPLDYKRGDEWFEEYWYKQYYKKGLTPQETWNQYTTIIN